MASKKSSTTAKPAAKAPKKTAAQTAAPSGVAISPLNGAKIPLGAHPGNTGGKPGRSGRIKEKVKRQLLQAAAKQGARVLEAIASGETIEKMRVPIAELLPHVRCPRCRKPGLRLVSDDPADGQLIQIEVKTSASIRDRRGAVDTMLKYSVGLKDELTVVHPDVQSRVEQTVQIIGSRSEWNSGELLAALSPVWNE